MQSFDPALGIVVCSVLSEPHRVLRFSRCAKGIKSRPYLTDKSWSPSKQGVSDCRTKGKGERNEITTLAFRNRVSYNLYELLAVKDFFKVQVTIKMRTFQKLLALLLIALFLSFSFNAYACLVPIYGGMKVSQGSDCTTPGEEPAAQFCDGFKSLAVQSGSDISSSGLASLVLPRNISTFFSDQVTTSHVFLLPAKERLASPEDILVLISVFRI